MPDFAGWLTAQYTLPYKTLWILPVFVVGNFSVDDVPLSVQRSKRDLGQVTIQWGKGSTIKNAKARRV